MLAPWLGFVRPMLLNSLSQLLFGARHIDLTVSSAVTGTTRQYRTAQDLDRDTINARIWLGIHFRTAMTDGNQLGHRGSHWALRHYFQPIDYPLSL